MNGSYFVCKTVKKKGNEFVLKKLNEFCMASYGHSATDFKIFDDGRIVDESDEGNCGPMSKEEIDDFAFFLKNASKQNENFKGGMVAEKCNICGCGEIKYIAIGTEHCNAVVARVCNKCQYDEDYDIEDLPQDVLKHLFESAKEASK